MPAEEDVSESSPGSQSQPSWFLPVQAPLSHESLMLNVQVAASRGLVSEVHLLE